MWSYFSYYSICFQLFIALLFFIVFIIFSYFSILFFLTLPPFLSSPFSFHFCVFKLNFARNLKVWQLAFSSLSGYYYLKVHILGFSFLTIIVENTMISKKHHLSIRLKKKEWIHIAVYNHSSSLNLAFYTKLTIIIKVFYILQSFLSILFCLCIQFLNY